MFTGIIQQLGTVVAVERKGGPGSLLVRAAAWDPPLQLGESVAVMGVCLTVTTWQAETMRFDLLNETFERTNLGTLQAGSRVNLERALRVGDPLGGHFVTGHVDGTGRVLRMTPAGRDWICEIACAPALLADMVPKGSIALDGISLTLVDVLSGSFTVHIIPHTYEMTAMQSYSAGTAVNLETDMLGKYVRRIVTGSGAATGVTWEKLRDAGFSAPT